MKTHTQFSAAVIKHISKIAKRGDIKFARSFLEAQNYSKLLHAAIEKNLESTQVLEKSVSFEKRQLSFRKVPFLGEIRVYKSRRGYDSSPSCFRNSRIRSYTS